MAEPERPLWEDLRAELERLGADLQEMVRLRWQLARLEIDAAAGAARRLAIVLAVAGALALTALPLLAVALAEVLDGQLGVPRIAWLAIFASVLLVAGAVTGWLAWRHFRRRLVGLEESLEELREDAVWLREWVRGPEEKDE